MQEWDKLNYSFVFFPVLHRSVEALCLQWAPNSFLLLMVAMWGFIIMYNFSVVHKLHVFVAGLYVLPLSSVLKFTVYVEPLCLMFQIWVLKVVSVL